MICLPIKATFYIIYCLPFGNTHLTGIPEIYGCTQNNGALHSAHSLHALHIRTVASFDVIPNALRRMTLFFLDPCCNGVPHCAMVAIKRNHTTSELVKRAFSIQNFNTFSYARILQYCNTDFDYWLKDCAQHIWKYIMTFMSLHIRRLLCISYVVLFPFVTVYLHLSILILLLDSS